MAKKIVRAMFDPMLCASCGAPLDHMTDYNSNKHKMFKLCRKCRIEDERRQNEKACFIAKANERRFARERQKMREQWTKEGNLCVRCGGMLRGLNNAYKVCGRCMREDAEREARKTRVVERMSPVCKGCPFVSFHGDFYSCLSAFGTGPLTKDCLRYTAGKTLRMRVIIEEIDDDE